MKNTCQTCKYCVKEHWDYRGRCLRHAPITTAIVHTNSGNFVPADPIWPSIDPRRSWCGDWEQKEPEEINDQN